jgi:hypothetical protein
MDAKKNWLTNRQLQSDFDLEDYSCLFSVLKRVSLLQWRRLA